MQRFVTIYLNNYIKYLIIFLNNFSVKRDLCNRCPVDDLYLCIQSFPVKDNTTDQWIAPEHCICNEGFALNDNKTQCVGMNLQLN